MSYLISIITFLRCCHQINKYPPLMEAQIQTLPQFSQENVLLCLRASYLSQNNKDIAKSNQILLKYYDQQPILLIQSLVSIIQSNANDSSVDDLKKAASRELKTICFKFTWMDESSEQKLEIIMKLMTKMYSLLTIPNLLTKGSKAFISEAIAITSRVSEDLDKQVYSKLSEDLMTFKDGYVLNSLKQICSAFIESRETASDLSQLLKNLLPLIKHIIVLKYQEFIAGIEAEIQKECLGIIEDYLNLLDSTLVILVADSQSYGQILRHLQLDAQYQTIFIKFLEIGLKQSGSILTNNKTTPMFNKVNKAKELILEIIEKIYVSDPVDIINISIYSVLNCETNLYLPEQHIESQVIIKCFDLLLKNINFNQNYVVFSMSITYLLTKCLSLCKLTSQELLLIEEDPEKFVESTEDFCDRRQEYSIRMKSAELIRAICKIIDGGLTYLKTICYDLLRNIYYGSKMTYDISNTEIFLSSDLIKKEVSLMVLALIYPLIQGSEDSVIQMKAFLLEMIEHFHEETELLVQLRIINLIGYCVDTNYFPYISNRVKQDPLILKYQCFSTLNRILRTNKLHMGAYQFLSGLLLNEIPTIQPSSVLFETIVITNYSKLLEHHPNLKLKCVDRVIECMLKIASTYDHDPHEQVPFHHFLSMIQLETNNQNIRVMEQKFSVITKKQSRRQAIQPNMFAIMTEFLSKLKNISQVHLEFAQELKNDFYQYHELREFFLYINSFIYFNTTDNLPFQVFLQYLGIDIMNKDTLLSPIVFLIGQMYYKHSNIIEMENTIPKILKYYEECDLEITKGRLINILLQGLMQNPQRVLGIINQQKYTFILKQIQNNIRHFSQPLDRKICIIGVCSLLKMEGQNNHCNLELFMSVVKMLELQYTKQKNKGVNFFRYVFENDNEMEEEDNQLVESEPINRMGLSQECANNIQEIASFDSNYYKLFLHPISSLDQFGFFADVWAGIKHLYIPQLDANQSKLVRGVLDIKKVGQSKDKTRRIVKIKKN